MSTYDMNTYDLDSSQVAALDFIRGKKLVILTGGPGTGKTTICKAVLGKEHERLGPDSSRYPLLAAPTGKAARRLKVVTGERSSTIHRLLGWGRGDGHEYEILRGDGGRPRGAMVDAHWEFGTACPLKTDLVIIDEASMIDISLAAALFRAIGSETRLLLVGDADQLPPVGPGRVFADLVECAGRVPVVRLTTIHRSKADSWVCRESVRLIHGEVPSLVDAEDFSWVPRGTPDEACDAVVEQVCKVLPKRGLGIPLDSIQVLVPQNVGRAGSFVLNQRLQEALNPARPGEEAWSLGRGEDIWQLRRLDRVIQIRNDYDKDVMNGEIGVVVALNATTVTIRFEAMTPLPAYDPSDIDFADLDDLTEYTREEARDNLRLAYALSIHKSQGSEWSWVVVLCHSTHSYMLTRRLLYTAITRAQQGIVLVGDERGVRYATKTVKDVKRNSAVAEALKGLTAS